MQKERFVVFFSSRSSQPFALFDDRLLTLGKHAGGQAESKCRRILQFSLKGVFLAMHSSVKEAAKAVAYKWPTNLSKSLKRQGRRQRCAGFLWEYG